LIGNWKLALGSVVAHDGDARAGKRSEAIYDDTLEDWGPYESSYYISSNVLGRVVSETTKTGGKKHTYIVAGGIIVAHQLLSGTTESVGWTHTDPSGVSGRGFVNAEFDALGNNVGTYAVPQLPQFFGNTLSALEPLVFVNMNMGDCSLDGVYVSCTMAQPMLQSGEGLQARVGYLGSRTGHIVYRDYDFDRRLPGVISVYIPGSVWETDQAAQDTEDHIYVGSTGEHPGQWLTIGFDSGGGNRWGSGDDIKKDFYDKYGKIFNECLKEVFKKDAPVEQTLKNSPTVIGEPIGGKAGTIVAPSKNYDGAIVINSLLVRNYGLKYKLYGPSPENPFPAESITDEETLITYGHELANLLDARKNLKGKMVDGVRELGRTYGNPDADDPDTGQAVEDCMKRKSQQ